MIVIVDYNVGNVGSMANMLRKIGVEVLVSNSEKDILQADKLILSGVGSFDQGMGALKRSGLIPVLEYMVMDKKAPLLGVCLGMQILGKASEEGTQEGLGWINFSNVRFCCSGNDLKKFKIPHMGWNEIEVVQKNGLFSELPSGSKFYFVHSFHPAFIHEKNIIAYTFYGYPFVSAVANDNIMGVQFHPEKSLRYGMAVLKNFVERT